MNRQNDSQIQSKQQKFNISYLSNADLISRFGKLVLTERKITHLVLECIAEIDSRKIYLDKAYPSLFEFLVKEFGYSSSAALRRIESARLLREVPSVEEKIKSGALNLSQLSKVQQAVRAVKKTEGRKLNVSEKLNLLNKIENTSQEQTEVILSQALALPIFTEDKTKHHANESVTLTITFSKEQMALLKNAQDCIAHAVPNINWADTMTYLARKEIDRRTKTRSKLDNNSSKIPVFMESESEVANSQSKITPATGMEVGVARATELNSKPAAEIKNKIANRQPVPVSVRKHLIHRDQCCQYRDKITGRICGSRRFLQVDHRQAVWAGGDNQPSNLQILCAQHNQHKYRRESFRR